MGKDKEVKGFFQLREQATVQNMTVAKKNMDFANRVRRENIPSSHIT